MIIEKKKNEETKDEKYLNHALFYFNIVSLEIFYFFRIQLNRHQIRWCFEHNSVQ